MPFGESRRALQILSDLCTVIESGYAGRALQRSPHLVLLNADWYHTEMRPVMARWAYLWMEANHLMGVSMEDAVAYTEHGPPKTTKAMLEAEKSQIEGLKEGSKDKSWVARTARMEQEIYLHALGARVSGGVSTLHMKLLNLVHDWLKSYLPHCLQKIDRVSFGIMNSLDRQRALEADPNMPSTRAKLAIPFVGKDVPSRSSEFAHPDVVLGLTVLAYRYEGMRWGDFDEIVQTLRTDLEKEVV